MSLRDFRKHAKPFCAGSTRPAVLENLQGGVRESRILNLPETAQGGLNQGVTAYESECGKVKMVRNGENVDYAGASLRR